MVARRYKSIKCSESSFWMHNSKILLANFEEHHQHLKVHAFLHGNERKWEHPWEVYKTMYLLNYIHVQLLCILVFKFSEFKYFIIDNIQEDICIFWYINKNNSFIIAGSPC